MGNRERITRTWPIKGSVFIFRAKYAFIALDRRSKSIQPSS
jgi:hypothetical protein